MRAAAPLGQGGERLLVQCFAAGIVQWTFRGIVSRASVEAVRVRGRQPDLRGLDGQLVA